MTKSGIQLSARSTQGQQADNRQKEVKSEKSDTIGVLLINQKDSFLFHMKIQ